MHEGSRLIVSLATVAAFVGGTVAAMAASAQNATQSIGTTAAPPTQCDAVAKYVGRLADGISDLGSGIVVADEARTVQSLGTSDCPKYSTTKCEKLKLIAFMFALNDMAPQSYRRRGMAAFLANVQAEDSSIGSVCSAEKWGYSGPKLRSTFKAVTKLCEPASPDFALAQNVGMVLPDGRCDPSDAALGRLKDRLVSQAPASIASRKEYLAGLAPVVARLYHYTNGATSDEAAFRYRGRGFIQITGVAAYAACQSNIVKARANLEATHRLAAVNMVSGIDWKTADVVRDPELVSQNRWVAAFCAASYWNDKVVKSELVTPEDEGKARFKAMVRAVNPDARKFDERYPGYQQWCTTVKCSSNFPVQLDLARGFDIMLGKLPRGAVS